MKHPKRLRFEPTPLIPLVRRLAGDEKHDASAKGTLPIMWALYAHVLRIDPERPDAPERDRFLLSKGHGPMAFYAALAFRGFFSEAWLDTFLEFDSPLGAHPDRTLIPGVEISSGSLGHGLPIATGVAWALRARGRTRPRIFTLVGDGELDEGSNHEAMAFAARTQLGQLTAIVVDNQSASHGWPGGLGLRFRTEGWDTLEVDGHDGEGLVQALDVDGSVRPRAVVVRAHRRAA